MGNIMSTLEDNGLVFPDNKNNNLDEIKEFCIGKQSSETDRKLLIILDALGFSLLEKILDKHKDLKSSMKSAEIKKGTTLFPSTTPTVLTSFDSGLSIAQHGVVGDSMPVRALGMMLNPMSFSPSVPNSAKLDESYMSLVFPEPKLMNQISKNNKIVVLMPANLAKSTYCKSMHAGSKIMPYMYFEDLFIKAEKLMREKEYGFVYIYTEAIDEMSHTYTWNSEEVEQLVVSLLSRISRQLFKTAKETGYGVLITADHGHTTIKRENIHPIECKDKIMSFTNTPPWGSHRYGFIDIVDGKKSEFEAFFEKEYGKAALLFKSDDAINSGLFGDTDVRPDIRYRFGEYTIIALDSNFFYYLYPGKKRWWEEPNWRYSGIHGGMHADEMYVPIITL